MILTNQAFLKAVTSSFNSFIASGTSRSNAKLKPLHGAIASDLASRLGAAYQIYAQGYGSDREASIRGRYADKKVDITIAHNGIAIAGIAVKFVMQNYSQNSVNYFENMLGETANIRSESHPYFQIFIILDKLPYYKRSGEIARWETFTDHNIAKYTKLSQDNVDVYMHTPNKTLIYVVHVPENEHLSTLDEYLSYYREIKPEVQVSQHRYESFGSSVIMNDYEEFASKVFHSIMAL